MNKISKNKIKTWFVTGASSGVGHELCSQLLEKGYNVIAVSRRIPDFNHNNALCLSVDVKDIDSIKLAVEKGIRRFGKIDVLSNNAGITANILLEDETSEHLKEVLETNFYGTFNTMKVLSSHFRENNNGTIINNTSQSGLSPRSYGSAYCASKHAIEAISGVFRIEAQHFCRVMTLELGYFSGTGIMQKASTIKNQYPEYSKLKAPHKPINYSKFKNDLHKAISILITEVEKEKIQRHLILGKDAIIRIEAELKTLETDLKTSKSRAISCSIPKYKQNKFIENIFSVKNSQNKKHKIITILGIKIKFRRK